MESYGKLLSDLLSMQQVVRLKAKETLEKAEKSSYGLFLSRLSIQLAKEKNSGEVHQLAGLLLKNALDIKEVNGEFDHESKWSSLPADKKEIIRGWLLQTLSSPVHEGWSTASKVVAKIASIESGCPDWPEMLKPLLSNDIQPANVETLGNICQEVPPSKMSNEVRDKILEFVIKGMESSDINHDVRVAAIRAFRKALPLVETLEGNMGVILGAAKSSKVEIQQAAFECLVSICSYKNLRLSLDLKEIIHITNRALNDEDSVALQAIEFWSSLCETEIKIKEDRNMKINDYKDQGLNHINAVVPDLVRMLLGTLERRDDKALGVVMAGGTCLFLLAQLVEDRVVDSVVQSLFNSTKAPWVGDNVVDSVKEYLARIDCKQMEVIFHAFGSISEGTTEGKLMEIAAFIIDPMLDALKNGPSNYTKVIAAWALARLFRSVPCTRLEIPQIIKERCRTIIFHLTSSMNDVLEVAENACAALYYFLEIFERAPKQVVPYVLYFLPALCSLTHRADCSEYLRKKAGRISVAKPRNNFRWGCAHCSSTGGECSCRTFVISLDSGV